MDTPDFSRSQALNNIPKKKLLDRISIIENGNDELSIKNVKLTAINRYAESNIPIEYWDLKMEKDFKGDPRLLEKYNEYVADIKASYFNGTSICFAGSHGAGKTMVSTCILKKACQKGFSCSYVIFGDVINTLIYGPMEDRFIAKKELMMTDFLVLDELDPRFMQSENASDLYARSLEGIFRTRAANKLPTLICTNSPNVMESFKGPLKASLGSLMNGYMTFFSVLGNDFRKEGK